MNEIQHIPPQVPDVKTLNGREYNYRNEKKNIFGVVIESQRVVAVGKSISVVQWKRDKAGIGEWLQVVGGVAIIFLGLCLLVQGIKGVLQSESNSGNGVQRVATGFRSVDRLVG